MADAAYRFNVPLLSVKVAVLTPSASQDAFCAGKLAKRELFAALNEAYWMALPERMARRLK